jgi:hypothetical protein
MRKNNCILFCTLAFQRITSGWSVIILMTCSAVIWTCYECFVCVAVSYSNKLLLLQKSQLNEAASSATGILINYCDGVFQNGAMLQQYLIQANKTIAILWSLGRVCLIALYVVLILNVFEAFYAFYKDSRNWKSPFWITVFYLTCTLLQSLGLF